MPLTTRDTVAVETPAFFATSLMFTNPPGPDSDVRFFNGELFFSIHLLLFKQGIQSRLGNLFVDLGFGSAGGNTAQQLALDLDGQAALVGEIVGKVQRFVMAVLYVFSRIPRRAPVSCGVASFSSGQIAGC